jgi:hypothetical protein
MWETDMDTCSPTFDGLVGSNEIVVVSGRHELTKTKNRKEDGKEGVVVRELDMQAPRSTDGLLLIC